RVGQFDRRAALGVACARSVAAPPCAAAAGLVCPGRVERPYFARARHALAWRLALERQHPTAYLLPAQPALGLDEQRLAGRGPGALVTPGASIAAIHRGATH